MIVEVDSFEVFYITALQEEVQLNVCETRQEKVEEMGELVL